MSVFRSTEFWAVLIGAVMALLPEAMRRWMHDRRAEFVRATTRREPYYHEFIGHGVTWNPSERVPIGRLGFLLRSHNPDLLNSLAAADRFFFDLNALAGC